MPIQIVRIYKIKTEGVFRNDRLSPDYFTFHKIVTLMQLAFLGGQSVLRQNSSPLVSHPLRTSTPLFLNGKISIVTSLRSDGTAHTKFPTKSVDGLSICGRVITRVGHRDVKILLYF